MTTPSAKILVIRGGAIGDFILTLPAIAALRRQFPDTHVEVLGYPHIVQLAQAGGLVDTVRSIEAAALAGFFARNGALDPHLQEYFKSFAVIVSYLYDPDRIFQENVARCTKAQFIAGAHRPDEAGSLHATETFLKPLERLAIFDADVVPRLKFTFDQRHATVALHPGSGSEKKNWPEDRWAELIDLLLKETSHNLMLVGGEAEGDRLQRLVKTRLDRRISLADHLPLPDLAQRLSACAGFVGHDSGISHLAAAVGLPTVVLWGDSVQMVWRPQGEWVKVICNDDGLGSLLARRVATESIQWIFHDHGR